MTEKNDGQIANQPTSLSDRVRSLRLPERSGPAPRRRSWLPWSLAVLLAASTAALGFHALSRPSADQDKQVDKDARLSSAAEPSYNESGETVVTESKGNIIPIHQIQVSPKISGMVTDLDIIEGKWVAKGHVLAKLEDIDYKADLDHAEGALAEARQNVAELTIFREKEVEQMKARWAEANFQKKQLSLDRDRSIRLRGNALAERDFEQADSSYFAMLSHERSLWFDYELLKHGPRDSRIRAAEKRIAQAQADVNKTRWRWENCTIKAPIDGTILTKKAEQWNIVNPIAFNISASLCEMADLREVEVDLNIQEREIAKVFKNQRCKIRPEAYPDRVFEGFVSRRMPVADRAKGAVTVRVKLEFSREEAKQQMTDDPPLKPEMGVIVSFYKKGKN
ncbi:MAG TPA: efflux RND transporter periplasmic adaptor subunit [Gemmataceae bacterium]|nr:efflux RND transporter periplasmic adaptor subunit [Gemmataceae bacterium]